MIGSHAGHRHAVGLTRREWLQVGYSGWLGIGLPTLLAARAAATTAARPGRARSVVLIFLSGGPSHIDTFDMKPDAPDGIRGTFQPIATSVAGVSVCEHLPRLATRFHKFSLIRSMTHGLSHHDAQYFILTGIDDFPPGLGASAQGTWPCFAAVLNELRPRSDGLVNGVTLPYALDITAQNPPGQTAGLLGPRNNPWFLTQDPSSPGFRVEGLNRPIGLTAERLASRGALLAEIDGQRARLADSIESNAWTDHQRQACTLLTSGRFARAFAIDGEPDHVRDRYGRHIFGQSLLLARRLVEAGVPMIQANLGRNGSVYWDTHKANFRTLKNKLLPPLDIAVSALLDDLGERGLLEETLVLMLGEFGRTPRLGDKTDGQFDPDGRDHWAGCFCALAAGAGVRGGQVLGASDRLAAYPTSAQVYHPSDVGATIYDALGVDPATEIRDRLGRPLRINAGRPIEALYTGASV